MRWFQIRYYKDFDKCEFFEKWIKTNDLFEYREFE